MTTLGKRDARVSWHPYTQHGTDTEPLAVARASGAWLELEDGRSILDAISSWWAILHGHGTKELVAAMARQAETLDHVLFAGATHEPAVRLAERLVDAAPPGLARVFFSDDGSTAVEAALKLAYHSQALGGAPERTVFLALEGGYHGDTFGAMSVGDPVPFFEAYAPFLFDVRRVAPEEAAVRATIEEIGERLCAFVAEPLVQGANGMRMYEAEVLRAAREACDRVGALFVADEVMTGFGRTGALFACERAGVAPDLMCIAKGLTGGMTPLSATLATESIFEAFLHTDRARFFPHGHTFTAHPIGCAVALASLDLCEERRVPERLASIGERIADRIASLADEPGVAAVRHLGGIAAIDLQPPEGDEGGYFSELAPRLRAESLARGVLLRPLGNVLYALPPACTSDGEADRIADVMAELVGLTRG
ncbi:MAG TPA: adenosylmethionine--8-amino-7-oxononanoate transaminase [Planctomycetes bacterium]|nr:adenosylmethionine--8-amino-7-oxononanoate transaminase [Planctomycetota bacterium]